MDASAAVKCILEQPLLSRCIMWTNVDTLKSVLAPLNLKTCETCFLSTFFFPLFLVLYTPSRPLPYVLRTPTPSSRPPLPPSVLLECTARSAGNRRLLSLAVANTSSSCEYLSPPPLQSARLQVPVCVCSYKLAHCDD